MIGTKQLNQERLEIGSEEKDSMVKEIAKYIAISGGITSLTIAMIYFQPKDYLELTNNIAKETQTFPHYFTEESNEAITEKNIPVSLQKK